MRGARGRDLKVQDSIENAISGLGLTYPTFDLDTELDNPGGRNNTAR